MGGIQTAERRGSDESRRVQTAKEVSLWIWRARAQEAHKDGVQRERRVVDREPCYAVCLARISDGCRVWRGSVRIRERRGPTLC
ncbi:hypothetical protein PC116_g12652 [Phytophthora cactorum]|nr:hypothetical protein PC114_g16729 [Phytophthora cactorum]KAG3020791.1 hypothetical protein PC120_g9077 [Phytophthora cactorum]KAG4056441.1 hypothetical protein PC123_g8521 [Phytophthora cactorum]KAG4239360.1 hypothetical protein PC116_g12652 [Phytophthora cactorum]